MIKYKEFSSVDDISRWVQKTNLTPINIETIITKELIGQTDLVETGSRHISGGDLIYADRTTYKVWYNTSSLPVSLWGWI